MTNFQQTVLIYILFGAALGIAVYLGCVHSSEMKEKSDE